MSSLVSIVAAFILLLAAGLKLLSVIVLPSSLQQVSNQALLDYVLITLQLGIAFWLLSGLRAVSAARVTVTCFTIFAGISLYRAITGHESCGCFGQFRVNPWITATLDLAIVTGFLLVTPVQSTMDLRVHRRYGMAALTVAAVGIAALWLLIGVRTEVLGEEGDLGRAGSIVILEPEKWRGKFFPLHRHIDVRPELTTGNCTVFLYHHDCPDCLRALPKLEQRAREGKRVALIEVPPYAKPHADPVRRDTACLRGKLSAEREWFVETPVVIELSEGRVVSVSTPSK